MGTELFDQLERWSNTLGAVAQQRRPVARPAVNDRFRWIVAEWIYE